MTTIDRNDLIMIRDGVDDDRNFILASWLQGLYHGRSWYSLVRKTLFMNHYKTVVSRILDNTDTVIKIACLRESPDVVVGYCIHQGPVLHWVFCKDRWRRIGVAKMLLPKDTHTFTHISKLGKALSPSTWNYNPFLI